MVTPVKAPAELPVHSQSQMLALGVTHFRSPPQVSLKMAPALAATSLYLHETPGVGVECGRPTEP